MNGATGRKRSDRWKKGVRCETRDKRDKVEKGDLENEQQNLSGYSEWNWRKCEDI